MHITDDIQIKTKILTFIRFHCFSHSRIIFITYMYIIYYRVNILYLFLIYLSIYVGGKWATLNHATKGIF